MTFFRTFRKIAIYHVLAVVFVLYEQKAANAEHVIDICKGIFDTFLGACKENNLSESQSVEWTDWQ